MAWEKILMTKNTMPLKQNRCVNPRTFSVASLIYYLFQYIWVN